MLDNKLLNKVVDQIISETKIIDNKVYTPFLPPLPHPPSIPFLTSPSLLSLSFLLSHYFLNHCKNVYSLKNDQEIEYVWTKYKESLYSLETVLKSM